MGRSGYPSDPRLAPVDDRGNLICALCGRSFRALGIHVALGHGLAADDYREAWGLNRLSSLLSAESRRRYQDATRRDHRETNLHPVRTAQESQAIVRHPSRRLEARLHDRDRNLARSRDHTGRWTAA